MKKILARAALTLFVLSATVVFINNSLHQSKAIAALTCGCSTTEQQVRDYLTEQGFSCISNVRPESGTCNWLADVTCPDDPSPTNVRVLVDEGTCVITGWVIVP
jgi:hypothetical protein